MAPLDPYTWVAAMFSTFGTMLVLHGVLFADDEGMARAAGTNLGLWADVRMLAFASSLVAWFLVRSPGFEIISSAERFADAIEGMANTVEAEDRREDPSGATARVFDDTGVANNVDGLSEEGPTARGEVRDKGAKDRGADLSRKSDGA